MGGAARAMGWAVCVVASSSALAQVAPADNAARDAAAQRRAEERERAQREQLQRAPEVPSPAPARELPAWPETESPCFTIREVVLTGEASDSFQWVLADVVGPDGALGRCLGARGLDVAAQRAQRTLTARGYVTSRVLYASQDVSAGRLTLSLLPGRIRSIRFADGTSPRATRANAVPARPGDILDLRAVEQALENFKRVPTAEADIQISPAEAPDESDLVIQWKQALPLRVTVSADDSGSKSTGRYQGSTTFSLDDPLTLNDLFYVTLNHDLGGGDTGERGTRGRTLHYSLPWGDWLLGATVTTSRYRQSVAGAFQDYVYRGTSQNGELKLSRLVWRDASRKLTLDLAGWQRRSANFIDDVEIDAQHRVTGGWAVGATHKETLGRATLEGRLALKRGTAAFGALHAPEEMFDEGTSRMRITTADVNLDAPFSLAGQNLRYRGTWRAQWNGTALTAQDRFAIGGRYTVRGFDGESSLSAERGWLVRNDLGVSVGSTGAEAYVGADYGQVRGMSAQWLVGRCLSGAVVGVRGTVGPVSYDFFVGRPVHKPTYFRTAAVTAGFSLSASF